MSAVILLSLCAALTYGLSDFVGGVLTRRASAWAVATASQIAAGLLVDRRSSPRLRSAAGERSAWGAFGGIGAPRATCSSIADSAAGA